MAWSRDEILMATGGRLVREGKRKRFGEVVTDSSKVKRGSVFVALKGERLDGHRFVGDAVRRGARCVIVHRHLYGSVFKDVAVVELGTNHPGEIARLAEIADPDMGMITSVAAAHLEGLSSLAGVAREKGALYQRVRAGGTIAVNLDDPWARRLGAQFKGRKI